METNNGKQGGTIQGAPHSQGGVQAVITDTNRPIEVEGGEAIINKQAVSKDGLNTYTGTNKEVLSEINQSAGNGVPIMEKGGLIPMAWLTNKYLRLIFGLV